jgi:peptidoglycan/LPS O-acetylase OafA/YrhL
MAREAMNTDRQAEGPLPAQDAGRLCAAPFLGLQFLAIAWVVVNQFRFHLGLEAGARSGLVAKGYIGASLFFVVAGLLMCERYVRLRRSGELHYASMLWRRLSFIYPLHLAMLATMIVLLVIGRRVGAPLHHASFPFRDLPANLLLAQAWGTLPTDSWNFPSWLISADWFACIVFPLTAWLSLRAFRPILLALAAPMILFVAMFEAAASRGVLFTDMTTQIGALQTVPAMLLGAALRRVAGQAKPAPSIAAGLCVLAVAWIAAAATLRLSDLFIWPAFGVLVFGMTGLATTRRPVIAWVGWRYLGRLCVAIMLVYLPVDIVYFRAARWLVGPVQGMQAWLLLAGVFPAILLAAALAYHGFQQPLARWLRRVGPFRGEARANPT